MRWRSIVALVLASSASADPPFWFRMGGQRYTYGVTSNRLDYENRGVSCVYFTNAPSSRSVCEELALLRSDQSSVVEFAGSARRRPHGCFQSKNDGGPVPGKTVYFNDGPRSEHRYEGDSEINDWVYNEWRAVCPTITTDNAPTQPDVVSGPYTYGAVSIRNEQPCGSGLELPFDACVAFSGLMDANPPSSTWVGAVPSGFGTKCHWSDTRDRILWSSTPSPTYPICATTRTVNSMESEVGMNYRTYLYDYATNAGDPLTDSSHPLVQYPLCTRLCDALGSAQVSEYLSRKGGLGGPFLESHDLAGGGARLHFRIR